MNNEEMRDYIYHMLGHPAVDIKQTLNAKHMDFVINDADEKFRDGFTSCDDMRNTLLYKDFCIERADMIITRSVMFRLNACED